MKKLSHILFITLLSVGLWAAIPRKVVAQDILSKVSIQSYPFGASVYIDGRWIGDAPQELSLKAGVYHVRLTLSGFQDWENNIVVDNPEINLDQALTAEPDVVQLPGGELLTVWDSTSNKLHFYTSYVDGKQIPAIYDLDHQTIKLNAPPLGSIDPTPWLTRLDASGRGIYLPIRMSPSGRYIAYIPKDEQAYLYIFDTKTNRAFKTDMGFSSLDYGSGKYLTRGLDIDLVWSINETVVWVIYNDAEIGHPSYFIFLDNTGVKTTYLNGFYNASGEAVATQIGADSFIVARPSEQGFALVKGQTENGPIRFWVVNLATMIGQPLPFDEIYDAAFSPDGQWIYVAHADGLSRLSLNLKSSELISDVVAKSRGTCHVSLAPTLEYVYVDAESCHEAGGGVWIYKLHPMIYL